MKQNYETKLNKVTGNSCWSTLKIKIKKIYL